VFNVPASDAQSRPRCSIVEDGILVHLPRRSFGALQTALRSGENLTIADSSDSADVDGVGSVGGELVVLQWRDDASSGFDLTERLLNTGRYYNMNYSSRDHKRQTRAAYGRSS